MFAVSVKHGTPTEDELEELGSAATYQAVCEGLILKSVQRQDLAEKFFHVDGNYFLQYISNVGTLV